MAKYETERFLSPPEDYLKKHHLLVYMEDCMNQMLETKHDKFDPDVFIMQYFTNVQEGRHVMFRDYSYIHLTPHNRVSFVKLIWSSFSQIGRIKDLLSIHEYHSLITLLCPNFPFDILYKTARIILLDDALDCLISFSDFIYTFQLQFCYQEFLDKVSETYESLHQGEVTTQDTVVVPSSDDIFNVVHTNVSTVQDGVSVAQFLRLLASVCESDIFSTIHIDMLREVLHDTPTINYYGFLMALSRSEIINSNLGVLPKKSALFSHLPKPSIEEQNRYPKPPKSSLTRVNQPPLSIPGQQPPKSVISMVTKSADARPTFPPPTSKQTTIFDENIVQNFASISLSTPAEVAVTSSDLESSKVKVTSVVKSDSSHSTIQKQEEKLSNSSDKIVVNFMASVSGSGRDLGSRSHISQRSIVQDETTVPSSSDSSCSDSYASDSSTN